MTDDIKRAVERLRKRHGDACAVYNPFAGVEGGGGECDCYNKQLAALIEAAAKVYTDGCTCAQCAALAALVRAVNGK